MNISSQHIVYIWLRTFSYLIAWPTEYNVKQIALWEVDVNKVSQFAGRDIRGIFARALSAGLERISAYVLMLHEIKLEKKNVQN